MFEAIQNPYLVPVDGNFQVATAPTKPPQDSPSKKECRKFLSKVIEDLQDLQRILYAYDHHAILLIFQAMDAAGKDGTIRAVMSGVNPAGTQIFSFRVPTPEELDHDFLWRTTRCLPERGRIGIFNRSYYEEVLVVRVHPEFLEPQRLPDYNGTDSIWGERLASIREHEEHLANNGTIILKFWLNVSKEEQRQRFLERLSEPEKVWKFSSKDVEERQHWEAYMQAYEEALNQTSRPWAPWYAVPADEKPFMRLTVAQILVETLQSLGLAYPTVSAEKQAEFQKMKELLEKEER